MHKKYIIETLYEGNCPTCKEYQCSTFSHDVDKECSICKRKKVIDTILNKKVTITEISGGEIEGFSLTLSYKGKSYKCINIYEFVEVK